MVFRVLAIDLIDDPALIDKYERLHATDNIWPEVVDQLLGAGVTKMEIYRVTNRLIMLLEHPDGIRLPDNPEWAAAVGKCQKPIGDAAAGEWAEASFVFSLAAVACARAR